MNKAGRDLSETLKELTLQKVPDDPHYKIHWVKFQKIMLIRANIMQVIKVFYFVLFVLTDQESF